MKRQKYINIAAIIALGLCGCALTSCTQSDMSNKAERNAIKSGNRNFNKSKFDQAIKDYDKALDANHDSEAAIYDKALAALHSESSDSTALKNARLALNDLAKSGADAAISEKALYNLGCDAVYLGDYLKKASEDPANQNFADSLKNMSTESYKQAIEDYKALLRKKPNNLRAVQNLRIAQLKLPPEEQGGGGGNNNDQNKDQNQQQQQQQDQQQQQQQQQQPQPQQQQNQNDKQILQSVQAKENKTRKKQPGDPAYGKVTDKPW